MFKTVDIAGVVPAEMLTFAEADHERQGFNPHRVVNTAPPELQSFLVIREAVVALQSVAL